MYIMMIITKAAVSLLTLSSVVTAWIPKQRLYTTTGTLVSSSSSSSLVRSLYYTNNNNKKQQTKFIYATQLHSSSSTTSSSSNIVTEVIGTEKTESFRLSFKDTSSSNTISPWHDISMKNDDGSYNMVVEIPKMTKAKMEVATKEEYNPIAQDMKKGKLRDYHGPIFWNYGCIPQTWEDPNVKHSELHCLGDNDPIDVVEIGSKALSMGSIQSIKPLGVLAMIDDGELDWKVIAIATNDPMAETFNDINDVPKSILDGIREWFRWYKTPDDKPLNEFGYNEEYLNQTKAYEIIMETHEAWKALQAGTTDAGKLWTGTSK